jgi:aspartyl protease family protein
MLVDTGASITTITPQMARAIRFRAQGSERVRVGSGEVIEMPRGRISSLRAGEAQSNNLTVLVGSTPLLGQNFFSDYNVTLAQDFIVFRRRLR